MCFHVYSDRCTYVCADPECAMERRHPRPFRRIGLNGHDVAPSRIQPTSKHALKYLFSTGCRPSPRVESRDLSEGNFRLPNCRRIFIVLPFIVYLLLFIFPLVLFPLYSRILIEILKIIINSIFFASFLYASQMAP